MIVTKWKMILSIVGAGITGWSGSYLLAKRNLFWLLETKFDKHRRFVKKAIEIQEFNSQTADSFHFKWEVAFENSRPTLKNFTVYCNHNHQDPIEMTYDDTDKMFLCSRCINVLPKSGRHFDKTSIDYYRYKANIKGELQMRWYELTGQV